MDLLIPNAISLISALGARVVLRKARFMSSCHSLEQRMAQLELLNSQLLPYYATCFVGKVCFPFQFQSQFQGHHHCR